MEYFSNVIQLVVMYFVRHCMKLINKQLHSTAGEKIQHRLLYPRQTPLQITGVLRFPRVFLNAATQNDSTKAVTQSFGIRSLIRPPQKYH